MNAAYLVLRILLPLAIVAAVGWWVGHAFAAVLAGMPS